MKLKIDMTHADEGFSSVPLGDYICKVTKAELKSKIGDAASKYIEWTLTIGLGEQKGQKLSLNTSLKPKALFKLREFLLGCGIPVPKTTIDVDTDKVVGKIVGVTLVEGKPYEDKTTKETKQGRPEIKQCWKAIKTDAGWVREKTAEEAIVEDIEVQDAAADEDVEDIEI